VRVSLVGNSHIGLNSHRDGGMAALSKVRKEKANENGVSRREVELIKTERIEVVKRRQVGGNLMHQVSPW